MDKNYDILDAPVDDTTRPALYSSSAITGFSFFFSTIFGGIMAYQNLSRVGKKGTGVLVLLAGVGWVVFSIFLNYQVQLPGLFAMFIQMGAAWGMGYYVSDTYIPGHKNMPKRKIWVPLAIGLVIFTAVIVLVVFAAKSFSDLPNQ